MAHRHLFTSPWPGTEHVQVCNHQSSDPCLHLDNANHIIASESSPYLSTQSFNQLPPNNSPTTNSNIIRRPTLKRTRQASSSQESCTMPSVPSVPATSNPLATPPICLEGYQRNVRGRYYQEPNYSTSSHSSAISSAYQSSRIPVCPSSSRRPGNAINPNSYLNYANSSNISQFRNQSYLVHGHPWLHTRYTETNDYSRRMSAVNAIVPFIRVHWENRSAMLILHTSQSVTITVNDGREGTSQRGAMANRLYDLQRHMISGVNNMNYVGFLLALERIRANRGLTEDQINSNVMKITYSASNEIRDERQNAESCAICLDKYADGEVLGKMKCKHHFHFSCIKKWLQIKNACPLCRASSAPDA